MTYIIVPCCIYLRNDTFLKIKTLRYKCFWQCFGRSQDRIFMHDKFSCLNCSNQIVPEFDHDIIHILEVTHQYTTLDCCCIQKQLCYDSKSCNLATIGKIALLYQMSSFKWRVTVSGELMFLESYSNCDVTNTVTLLL